MMNRISNPADPGEVLPEYLPKGLAVTVADVAAAAGTSRELG